MGQSFEFGKCDRCDQGGIIALAYPHGYLCEICVEELGCASEFDILKGTSDDTE